MLMATVSAIGATAVMRQPAAVAGAPTSFQPDCQLPPWATLRAMFRKASALELPRPGERPDVDRVEPDRSDELEDRRLGRRRRRRRRSRRAGRPRTIGSSWLEANNVLNALTTRASGSNAASSSAFDDVVSMAGPVRHRSSSGWRRRRRSCRLRRRGSRRRSSGALENGVARTTTSADRGGLDGCPCDAGTGGGGDRPGVLGIARCDGDRVSDRGRTRWRGRCRRCRHR